MLALGNGAELPPIVMLFVALCFATGCGETTLRISLVPDENLNPVETVVAEIETIELQLGGIEALNDGDLISGSGIVADRNQDGAADWVAAIPIQDDLPELEIVFKASAGESVDIQALGIRNNDVTALGTAKAELADGDESFAAVDFNLLSQFRPPRVTSATPPDEGILCKNSDLPRFQIELSEDLSVPTSGETYFLFQRGAKDAIEGPPLFGSRSRYVWNFADFPVGNYRFFVTTNALDVDGDPLDQDPTTGFLDQFETSFTLENCDLGD